MKIQEPINPHNNAVVLLAAMIRQAETYMEKSGMRYEIQHEGHGIIKVNSKYIMDVNMDDEIIVWYNPVTLDYHFRLKERNK